jgi:transcriptional regulator with XRE-family HTH domain
LEEFDLIIGQQLQRLRIERGFSREAVAQCVGLTTLDVEEHELGRRRVEASDLAAYAELFDVAISEFFRDPPRENMH